MRLGDPRQWTEDTKITAAERDWQNLVAVPAGQKPRLPILIGWCRAVRSVSASVQAPLPEQHRSDRVTASSPSSFSNSDMSQPASFTR